jgi:hypothetical protein
MSATQSTPAFAKAKKGSLSIYGEGCTDFEGNGIHREIRRQRVDRGQRIRT